jgi:hypothetical protein
VSSRCTGVSPAIRNVPLAAAWRVPLVVMTVSMPADAGVIRGGT